MLTWKNAGLAIVFLWFMGGGVTHFTNPDLFPEMSPTALSIRLVVQVMLLACIWWSTRTPSNATE
jgi:uncharacterized membrane protein